MPAVLIDFLLFAVGCSLGVVVNWAIYRLAYINPRRNSPWSRLGNPNQRPLDFIPIVGWWSQRRLAAALGRGFWIRPLVVEVSCGLALPLFLRGIQSGILTSGAAFALPPSPTQQWIWLTFFFMLGLLLTAATFIDFDEKTIPDEITLSGTLFALSIAYLVPLSRLPNVEAQGGIRIETLHFASPFGLPGWHRETLGLVAVVVVIFIWMFALLPKTIIWRRGIVRGLRWMWASMWRRSRMRPVASVETPTINVVDRKVISGLGVLLIVLSVVAWTIGGDAWDNLFGAWMGLAFGGGLVWAVRIIAGGALGKEAMGFGDVTLMAMIGAWLGWQPALLVFAIAPFAALFIAMAQLLAMRHTEIAFGPYLSVGALVVVGFWGSIWHDWARVSIFSLGPAILVITLVCLILMAAMLGGWRVIRERWFGVEY